MDQFIGKVAIVTGANTGIGLAIAKAFVEVGMKVITFVRRKECIEEMAQELQEKPGMMYAVEADMTKEEDILLAFKWSTDNVGPVHVLINNAEINSNTDLTDGDDPTILEINVLGMVTATKEAIRIMQAENIDGHILNVNSTAGPKKPNFPNVSEYLACKHAVTALTKSLRTELMKLGSNIKVTTISPGFAATEIFEANDIMSSEEVEAFTEELENFSKHRRCRRNLVRFRYTITRSGSWRIKQINALSDRLEELFNLSKIN